MCGCACNETLGMLRYESKIKILEFMALAPRGLLNSHFGIGVQPEEPQMRA